MVKQIFCVLLLYMYLVTAVIGCLYDTLGRPGVAAGP